MHVPRVRNGKPTEANPAAAKEPAARKAATKKPAAKRVAAKKAAHQATVAPRKPRAQKPREKNLAMVERFHLAQRIVAARELPSPPTWDELAEREGIPARTLRWVASQFRAQMAATDDASGQTALEETLYIYNSSIAQLACLVENANQEAVRVGAVRVLLDALRVRIELLAVMGRMPRSFRAMDELAALQRLVRRFAEKVEEMGLPPEVVQVFIDLADEAQPVIDGKLALPSGTA